MTMIVIQNGQPVEVPRDVEAEGGTAVERWLQEQAAPEKPRKTTRTVENS